MLVKDREKPLVEISEERRKRSAMAAMEARSKITEDDLDLVLGLGFL